MAFWKQVLSNPLIQAIHKFWSLSKESSQIMITNAILLIIYYTVYNLIGFLNLAITYHLAEGTCLCHSQLKENRH